MTKKYILYKDGRIYFDNLIKHGLTWAKVNNIKCDHENKSSYVFLNKYMLIHSIYNVGNLQKHGKIVLPEPIAKRIIFEKSLKVLG